MTDLPQLAATCIPLLPTTNGFKVVLVQRASTMRFMPNAFAFPGGKVDDSDSAANTKGDRKLAEEYFAAARELREETGLVVAVEQLIPWSRWITPTYETRRFSAQFFLACIDDAEIKVDGSETVGYRKATPHALLEQSRESSDLLLPPPVLVTLQELVGFTSIEAVQAHARTANGAGVLSPQERTFLPWREIDSDGDRLYLRPQHYLRREHDRWVL